jgi:hypothetical protein
MRAFSATAAAIKKSVHFSKFLSSAVTAGG